MTESSARMEALVTPQEVISLQLGYLDSDLRQVAEATAANTELLTALGDTNDLARHAFLSVAVDLMWQVRELAFGVSVLLPSRASAPLIPVQRALWEAVANLLYLAKHPERNREAVIFQAYSYLKEIEEYPDQKALVAERQEILARMVPAVVEQARSRVSRYPKTWSGLKLSDVAKSAGLQGFDLVYGVLSGQAHAHRVGLNVRFGEVDGNQQQFNLGRVLSDEEVDAHARFARKALGPALGAVWTAVGSSRITFRTPSPDRE